VQAGPEGPSPLAERLLAGDKRALARAISLVEDDDPRGWALVREVYPRTGRATIVGFTGAPGAGKSTLGDLAERRRRNLMNEVLALVTARLRTAVAAAVRDDPEVQELLDAVVARRLDPASAARAILTRRPAADLSFADTSPQFADRL
jgi:putative protein kinase ArgK-like GTPase of G3E family